MPAIIGLDKITLTEANTNENNQEEADQFTEAWMSLDERAQRRMLSSIVNQVVFESEEGTVSVKLAENPTKKLSR